MPEEVDTVGSSSQIYGPPQLLVASLPAEAPLEHNFRYPRIRELTIYNDAIALGGRPRTF